MAVNKLKQFTDREIITLDDSDSDTDPNEIFSLVSGKKHVSLPDKNALIKEKVSLRIKLRRSTEQSLYKIDTDSDCETPKRKSHGRVLKPLKKNSIVIASDILSSDSTEKLETSRTEDKEFLQMQDENLTPRGTRIRRRPVRFNEYHCDTLKPTSLRSRRTINYNEDNLFLLSLQAHKETEKKVLRRPKKNVNYNSDSSVASHNSETKKSARISKRNHKPSENDTENDSGTDSKIIRTEPLKRSDRIEPHEETEKKVLRRPKKSVNYNSDSSVASHNSEIKKSARISKRNHKPSENDNENDSGTDSKLIRTEPLKRSDRVEPAVSKSETTAEDDAISKQKKSVSQNKKKNDNVVVKEAEDHHDEQRTPNTRRAASSVSAKNSNKLKTTESQVEESLPSTPKSHVIKYKNLTPSIIKRNSALVKPLTPLQEARSRLHVSAVPKSLPCREAEFNTIFTFLKGKLMDKSGGCIYISGVPGTGKTATVNEVVKCLQKLISKGQLNDFDYVAINGMRLTEPRQSYVQILKQLTGKTVTWEQAYRTLEKRFHSRNSNMTLLLVDELDFLCTKRQDVVYNLLDWPTKASAQLVVITIANTMDLPERVLMGRVTSRLGLTRLTFQPYSHKQLQEIVVTRLKDFNGFRSEAIQLVARKVSAVSGDARRALDICRRAMEIAEARNAETISMADVTQAVSEMIASAKIQAIKHCSKMEQIFLQAVSAEVTRTAVEEVYFKDAYRQLEALCTFDGIKIPTITEVLAVCGRLGATRLLICEHSKSDIYQKILLNVSTDDIHYALQELSID